MSQILMFPARDKSYVFALILIVGKYGEAVNDYSDRIIFAIVICRLKVHPFLMGFHFKSVLKNDGESPSKRSRLKILVSVVRFRDPALPKSRGLGDSAWPLFRCL